MSNDRSLVVAMGVLVVVDLGGLGNDELTPALSAYPVFLLLVTAAWSACWPRGRLP